MVESKPAAKGKKPSARKMMADKLGQDMVETMKIVDSVTAPEVIDDLWTRLDANENDISSLAEISSFIKILANDPRKPPRYDGFFVGLYNKKALLRAYVHTTEKDSLDGDAFVQKNEFPALLRNIYFYNKLAAYFEKVDTDGDARLTQEEFSTGAKKLGIKLTDKEAAAAFQKIDTNAGGLILFDEFCQWCIDVCGYGCGTEDEPVQADEVVHGA